MSKAILDAGTSKTEAPVGGAESTHAHLECERIRNRIKRDLTSAVADSENLLLVQDLKMWDKNITDSALEPHFKTPEAKAKALRENIPWVENNIKEGRQWGHWFRSEIEQAKKSGALTEENAKHAINVAFNRTGDWTTVKAFFTGKTTESFKTWLTNWRYMGDLLKKIDAQQKKMKMPDDALPMLKQLKSGTGKFDVRMALAEKTMTALLELEGKNSHGYREAKALLMHAVAAKAIAPGKVDGWLAHIFTKYKGEAAVRFIEKTLPSFIEDWKDVANAYHFHAKEFAKRGIKVMDEGTFFSLGFKEREKEVHKMRAMMSGDTVEQEKVKDLDYLKMRIRFNIASGSWDAADDLVSKMERDHPKNPDTKAMRTDLERKRQLSLKSEYNPNEKPPLPELQKQIWGFLDQIEDRTMRNLIETALVTQDIDVIERILQIVYNRYWCHHHGYLDEKKEYEELHNETNKQKTLEYAEDGHSEGIERNLVFGETANEAAIRGDNCNRPQLIYISNDQASLNSVVKKAEHHKHQKNSGWGYWTTAETTDGGKTVQSFAHTKNFVESIYYPMRSAMRQFFRAGGVYRRKGAASLPSGPSATK